MIFLYKRRGLLLLLNQFDKSMTNADNIEHPKFGAVLNDVESAELGSQINSWANSENRAFISMVLKSRPRVHTVRVSIATSGN